MSITVLIYYSGVNGYARRFAEEMEKSGTAAAIRDEKGNLGYEYYLSMNDPEMFLLITHWENQEAIDLHHASAMMKTITDLREKYNLHMRVERLRPDQGGVPDEDLKYIRE
ncbi:MAG: antibiotic biosynthesis monooxygenase [Clostridiaceae bacterium]|nr:antibiotic biosynthesis monooxygenase [Clostridiaceae bacterium]